MNKYLAKRTELAQQLKKEFNKSDYEIFTEMEIANELQNFLDNYEEYDMQLTDEQQETLIAIIYDFYIDAYSNVSIYSMTEAVLKTIKEFGSYHKFDIAYSTDYANTYDKIVLNLI